MKFILSSFCIFLFTSKLICQSGSVLYGAHISGTNQVFSSFNISTLGYTSLSILSPPYSDALAEKTFDELHHRYFVKRGSKIYMIEALSGNILDSLINVSDFYNFEYDEFSNSLIGIKKTASTFSSQIIDLNTKLVSIQSNLLGMDSLVFGESTFDQQNRRYFTLANFGLLALDSNGVFDDVLCSSPNLFGLEYNPLTNKISYMQWNFGNFDFVSIEANICSVELLANYPSVLSCFRGESTFNKTQGIYYNKTNVGILGISASSGQILQTIPVVDNFGGLEYYRISAISNILSNNINEKMLVFPNPSKSLFYFKNIKKGVAIEIYNTVGKQIYISKSTGNIEIINLGEQPKGIYFYVISLPDSPKQTGKIILE